MITLDEDEINDERDRAVDQNMQGGSQWPGMSYEQGVEAALAWVLGDSDDKPMDG